MGDNCMEGFGTLCFLSLLILFPLKNENRGGKKVMIEIPTRSLWDFFGKWNCTMCVFWFCGDREELVILSKTEAENKMRLDGKKRNWREFTFLPRKRLKLVSKVSPLNSSCLWFCDKGQYKKERWLTEKTHSLLGTWALNGHFHCSRLSLNTINGI